MASRAKSVPITEWRGLNERRIIGQDPRETASLDNVIVRNGVVQGRKGINEFDDITSADADTPILGLMDYYNTTDATSSLLRMTPTKVRKWNSSTHAWDDITGDALTGDSTVRPQFCMVGELNTLAFTNEGQDRPRKYSGSGNTAVWGGTPPYCKAIEYYVGFLALGNISTDGSTFSPLDIILSDDPDATWTECSDTDQFVTTMTLDESPGEIRALKVHGRALHAYKADCIVSVLFTGGPTRFQRQKMDFPMGILAPLSLQGIGEFGHIFVATDRNLYINDGNAIKPLPRNVQKSLQETMSASMAPKVRSMVDLNTETYILGYQRDGSTYLDALLEYNYRTGEFSRKSYPVEFNSMLAYKQTANTDYVRLASSSTLTYQLETGTDDNGTRVDRYFDVDWTQLGMPGDKWVTGGEFVFTKAKACRVKISLAVDKSSSFQFGKTYSLAGGDPDETEVRISYQLPTPVLGSWFKFRVNMYHDGSTNTCKLLEFEPEFIPLHEVAEDVPHKPAFANAA
jgi:hypothetical protein